MMCHCEVMIVREEEEEEEEVGRAWSGGLAHRMWSVVSSWC